MGQKITRRWFWRKKTSKTMPNSGEKGLINKIKSKIKSLFQKN